MTLLKIFNAKKEKKKNSPIKLKKVRRYTPNDSEILQKIDKKLFYAEINGADSIKINDPTSSDIRSYSLKLASIILEWIHREVKERDLIKKFLKTIIVVAENIIYSRVLTRNVGKVTLFEAFGKIN